jgi:hypothetical protein
MTHKIRSMEHPRLEASSIASLIKELHIRLLPFDDIHTQEFKPVRDVGEPVEHVARGLVSIYG